MEMRSWLIFVMILLAIEMPFAQMRPALENNEDNDDRNSDEVNPDNEIGDSENDDDNKLSNEEEQDEDEEDESEYGTVSEESDEKNLDEKPSDSENEAEVENESSDKSNRDDDDRLIDDENGNGETEVTDNFEEISELKSDEEEEERKVTEVTEDNNAKNPSTDNDEIVETTSTESTESTEAVDIVETQTTTDYGKEEENADKKIEMPGLGDLKLLKENTETQQPSDEDSANMDESEKEHDETEIPGLNTSVSQDISNVKIQDTTPNTEQSIPTVTTEVNIETNKEKTSEEDIKDVKTRTDEIESENNEEEKIKTTGQKSLSNTSGEDSDEKSDSKNTSSHNTEGDSDTHGYNFSTDTFEFDLPVFNESLHFDLFLNNTDWSKELSALDYLTDGYNYHDACELISDKIYKMFAINVTKEQLHNYLPMLRFLFERDFEELTSVRDNMLSCANATLENRENTGPICEQLTSLISKACDETGQCENRKDKVITQVMSTINDTIQTDQFADIILLLQECATESYNR